MSSRIPQTEFCIRLPPLSGEQARQICNLLDDIIVALWDVYGDAILDRLADLEIQNHEDSLAPEHADADDIDRQKHADDVPF